MAGHEDVFPTLHTVMVQAGERASFLEEVLASLSVFLERLDELRSKVFGALVYPVMLVFMGSAVMVGALIFFVPKFEPMLVDVDKPMPTEVVFFLSQMLRNHWLILIAAIIGFIASFIALMFFIDHMLIVAIIISIGSILIFRLVNKSHDE